MIEAAKIAIIGPGVMAEAILSGLLRKGITQPDNILTAGPRPERGAELQERYGIQYLTDNAAAARLADVTVLCVKPQRLDRVLTGLKNQLPAQALVISIVAGASILRLSEGLNHDRVVRSMPNTPGRIGEGITVWTVSKTVTPDQITLACSILSALGQEILVEEESYLDMATALSGTGPAYVYLFMEAMIDAGVHLGFPRRIAEQLVVQTIRGSLDYYSSRKIHPATLRNDVTSPGGTSAAALYYLEKAGFRTAISRAIWAAYERSQELGRDVHSRAPEKNDAPGS